MEKAWCSTCKQYLPISDFHKDAGRKGGLSARCKKCVHERDLSLYGRYKSYRRNANHRNLEFSITFDQFSDVVSKPCVYCGSAADPFNGIDRKDNTRGYTSDNLNPCCTVCNRIKLTISDDELKCHIRKMYNHLFS